MAIREKRVLGCLAAAILVLAAAPEARAQTITDIVSQSGGSFDSNGNDYDLLLTAVVTAGLAGALADPAADLTVFAPNDTAFVRLARDLGYGGWSEGEAWNFLVGELTDLGGGDPIPVLTAVLLYHVVNDEISPIELILRTFFAPNVETLEGGTFRVFFLFLIDKEPDLQNPKVRTPLNIQADNGVIHTIDRVLLPLDL
jgi:serralysin